jgi:hypothetical protein|tara:strand:- start:110 stop:643 length:534 start_codon:yes stop_codon:yes gene_type:complete
MGKKMVPGSNSEVSLVEPSQELPNSASDDFGTILDGYSQRTEKPLIYATVTVGYGLEGDVNSSLQHEARDELADVFRRRIRTGNNGRIPNLRNDQYGPDFLMAIEQVMKGQSSSGSATYGIILDNIDRENAIQVIERLRSELEFKVSNNNGSGSIEGFNLTYRIHQYQKQQVLERAS